MSLIDDILSAKDGSRWFTKDSTNKDLTRLLAKVHPDLHPDNEDKATQATIRIRAFFESATNTGASAPTSAPVTITLPSGAYTLDTPIGSSGGIKWYQSGGKMVALGDTGLSWLQKPAQTLKKILVEESFPTDMVPYFLKPIETVKAKTPSGFRVITVAESLAPEGSVTLREVKDKLGTISDRNLAWILRRCLLILMTLHEAGYSVTSIDLDSFLIHPTEHAVILKDFQYILPFGETVSHVSGDALSRLSTDIKESKVIPNGRSDLKLLAIALSELMGPDADTWFQNYLHMMSVAPWSAREHFEDFTQDMDANWGKRRYVSFDMG